MYHGLPSLTFGNLQRTHLALQAKGGRQKYICSNRKRALEALGKYATKSRLVQDCHESLNDIATDNKLKLMWIPGYSGVKGNIADDVTGLGTKMVSSSIRNWTVEPHSWEGKKAEGCRQSNNHMNTAKAKDWEEISFILDRRERRPW